MDKPKLQSRENPEEIRQMFDSIAPTYDTLNHVLSFGLDIVWRRSAIGMLREKKNGTFLDIAAGSGDVSIDLQSLNPRRVIATDFSLGMLSVFHDKLLRKKGSNDIHLVASDAHDLPFRAECFDGTIVAFGIRNFANRLASLSEMLRVLKPGGLAIVLELSMPETPVISQCYRAYARWILPLIGKIISRNGSAYSYLPSSISAFPERREFLSLMKQAGFVNESSHSLTFGVATIYSGRKRTVTHG